ncbi:MAG TPA: hypothetical protein VGK73_40025, partial [Polyangiaceae bacterium]
MTERTFWLVLVFLVSTLAGCGVNSQPPPPVAPTPLRVATPRVYAAADAAASSGGIEDICKIDPAACPRLDQSREDTRRFREPLYAVHQTDADRGSEIALTGPLAAAPAA